VNLFSHGVKHEGYAAGLWSKQMSIGRLLSEAFCICETGAFHKIHN